MRDKKEKRETRLPTRSIDFINRVEAKEKRKLLARREKHRNIWFGFSMFGLVGWSVVIPGLLGAALGIWIDKHHQNSYSWTLMLMIAGVGLGCLNAWRWVENERGDIHKEHKDGGGDDSV